MEDNFVSLCWKCGALYILGKIKCVKCGEPYRGENGSLIFKKANETRGKQEESE